VSRILFEFSPDG